METQGNTRNRSTRTTGLTRRLPGRPKDPGGGFPNPGPWDLKLQFEQVLPPAPILLDGPVQKLGGRAVLAGWHCIALVCERLVGRVLPGPVAGWLLPDRGYCLVGQPCG